MTESNKKSGLSIVIETKDLVHALQFSGSIVEKRNVLAELGNIKLSAKNGLLSIGATDMDLYLNQDIGAKIISEGETTVSTQTLTDIVKRIPDDEIKFVQIDENKLEITGKKCRFELLTLPVVQFPILENISSESAINLECNDLARLIEYTHFSMSTEETRYNLNGIFMHIKDKNFCCVATDGHRLSFSSVPFAEEIEDFGVIVPRKTVNELLKILRDNKNNQSSIQIFLSNTKIQFKCNNWVLVSKLIDGTFPEYSSFIPSENENKLYVNTKLLASSIDRVAVINAEKFRAVKFMISESEMKINASGEAKGAGVEQVEFSEKHSSYCKYIGSEISIGFNPKYLSDVLTSLHEDKVEVYFKDAFSPVLIKTSDNAQDSFVVMPVKV